MALSRGAPLSVSGGGVTIKDTAFGRAGAHETVTVTVDPVKAPRGVMTARSAACGDLSLDLRYANLLEFSFSDSILDDWDDDF